MSNSVPIEAIVDRIERRLAEPPEQGRLHHSQVEALDVVNHALVFDHHPRSLELWREALWQRRLPGEARQAIVHMLAYLTDQVAQGDVQAVARVCDCLQVFVEAAAGPAAEPQG